jgi:hypothetical protein
MRGIINYVQGFITEAREFGFKGALREHRVELARSIDSHFGNHFGGSMSGVFVRLPFTRLSAWLQWREVNCGMSLERTPGNLQVWMGRLELVMSTEPRPATAEAAE